jgi:signal transduction histidine kinase
MAELTSSRVRTRLAPLLFGLAMLPVAGLAVWFHVMALRSVESVLERQTLATVQAAASGVDGKYQDLLPISTLPARSRVVRRALGSSDLPRAKLRTYAQWYLGSSGERFAQIIFVDASGLPVYKYDPGSTEAIGQQLSGLEPEAPTDSSFDPGDGQGLPGPGQRLRVTVQSTTAHGQVFRFARPVGLTRRPGLKASGTGVPTGYVLLDVPISKLLTVPASGDIELLVIDREAAAILLSPNFALNGEELTSALPGLAVALLTAQVDESMKFTEGGIDRIAAIATLDKPAWTIVASIDTEPYIASPRRTGIFTLAATGLFVLAPSSPCSSPACSGAPPSSRRPTSSSQNRLVQEANAEIAQATENKSKFLRRMSHDLRSPMNAIIGFTRILRRRLADRINEREARNLANIETSSGNLLNLINAILDLGRIEAGHIEVNLQPVDVRQLANECADALESIVKEGVELSREMADVGEVNTDADRLREIVMNLLGNATKFTEAGSITLSLRRDEGGKIELSIADTGIPPDDLPHIFEEFRQVERQGKKATEGTGLGLAIAKKTVGLLGGEITATSEVGVGTTFTVRLSALRGAD